ncbi:helix-turn-helix domain-containing protein [Glaciihabitans sp. UYNi722]|uniref:PucR family transcriptional regulator n=1 Tax=Glaciihabitans sp. UYNi722 TaxID=3156344 RepID=UPI0033977682
MSDESSAALPTLAELARSIASDVAALVETPQIGSPRVSGTALYDSSAPLARFPGAIALAIGIPISGAHLPTRLQGLKDAGYVCLVYKAHGADDTELRSAARTADVALFRAADSVPWHELAEIFAAAVVPHRRAGRTLADIRPGDLFALANTVASLVGGAVAFADPEQNLLAYSTLPEQPIDDTRRNSILQLHVPHTDQNDADYARVHASRSVESVAPSENSLTRSAVAIRAGSVVLGSLWLIADDAPIDPDVEQLLLEASNVAALHLLHRRTNHDSGRTRQIELVSPLLFQADRAELAAVQLGIVADSVRIVAMTALGRADDSPDAFQASLSFYDIVRTACAVWLPGTACGLADNIVYVVLPESTTTSWPFQHDGILRIAHHAQRAVKRMVLAGFGGSAPIAEVASSRREAEAVLAILLRDAEDGRLNAESDDIVSDRQSLGPRLQLGEVVTRLRDGGQLPGDYAIAIAEHDSRRKTAFEQTLRIYLDCGSNAIETSARLGLHANTVRYRLSRVEPLFGIRLDDPETRLLLWLQLWARQH